MRVAWIVVLTLLAGCTSQDDAAPWHHGEDSDNQRDHFAAYPEGCNAPESNVDRSVETITITSEGPFDIAIPVPVSEATSFDEWLQIIGGTHQESQHGDVIAISGSGTVSWCHLQVADADCCAEGYLDAQWSTDGFWLQVVEGAVTYDYEARSNYCGADATYEAQSVGWHEGEDWIARWCQ